MCWNYLYATKGERCKTVRIPELILIEKTKEALGIDDLNKEIVKEKLKSIVAYPDRVLEFVFNDGTKKSIPWELKSRRFSWSEEAREKARNNALRRYEDKKSKQ